MPHVNIRFYKLQDAAALFEAARESITEVQPWLPWCHPQYRIDESREWIASEIENRRAGTEYNFVVVDDHNAFLGGCGLNQINTENLYANLGYWVRTSAAGRGIACRATQLLADWAFENTDLRRLEIVCAVDNTASQRVAEKAGAMREGVARSRLLLHGAHHDAVIYSIVTPNTEHATVQV